MTGHDVSEALSARERQIARAYADGLSYREIAERLFISPATVRTHLRTIYRKLGISTKIALLRALEDEPEPDLLPEDATTGDERLAGFLREIDLEVYGALLAGNDIDLDLLRGLTDGDLKELGIASLGHRLRILRHAQAGAGEPDAAPPPEREPDQRKRQVSVMIVELADAPDPAQSSIEKIHQALSAFREFVDKTAHPFRGATDHQIGERLKVVFGIEHATGHDASQAVAAARAVQDAAARELDGRGLRIGLATGQVVLTSDGDRAADIAGATLSLANRLAARAAPGQILLSAGIYRSLADEVNCVRAGAEGEEEAWLLEELSDDQRPGLYIGRRAELEILATTLEEQRNRGTGRTVCIRGEAGIGKTALVNSLLDSEEAEGIACISAFVLDFGGSETMPVTQQIARDMVAILAGETTEPTAESIDRLVADGLLPSDLRLHAYHLCGCSIPVDLAALDDALDARARDLGEMGALESIARLTAGRLPLVVRIEDLHWADTQTRESVALLAGLTGELPLVLILTTRFADTSIDTVLREHHGLSGILTLELQGLAGDESEELAEKLGGDRSAEDVRSCLERAQGNPLFLRQLIAHLQSREGAAVPSSIQGVIQSRIDQVPRQDRMALEAAAVLGQRFSADAVRELVGDPSFAFTSLLTAGFVQYQRQDYLFAHALIRDAIYDLTLKQRRDQLHLAAADWFRDTAPDLQAVHLDTAGDPGAAAAYLRAGTELARASRLAAAMTQAERGLALAPEKDVRFGLDMLRARLLLDLGRGEEAGEAYRGALDTAVRPLDRCRAMLGLVAVMRIVDRIDEAFAFLDQAEAVAAAGGFDDELAQIHYFRGSLHFPRGDIAGCLAEHGKAVDFAERCGDQERKAQALSGLGDAYYAMGRMHTAYRHFGQCLDIAQANRLGRIEASNLFMRATVRIYLHETVEALEDVLASIRIAEQTQSFRAEIVSRLTAGWILISKADLDAAGEQFDRGLAIARRVGARRFEPFLNEGLARVHLFRGDRERAETVIRDSVRALEEDQRRFIGPWVLGTLARVTRDPAERATALGDAEALLSQGCVGHNYYRFHHAGIEIGLEDSDPARLRHHAAALADYTSEEPAPWSDLHIHRARVMATLLDTPEAAAAASRELSEIARAASAVGLELTSRRTSEWQQRLTAAK